MIAILVHHSDAVGPGVDSRRPLSALGQRQAAALADQARAAGLRPAAAWHSGKLRARQTAEAFVRACNPMAELRMVRGLLPDDPPEWIRLELDAGSRDVLLVGHMPHIAALARLLSKDAEMPLNGAIVFVRGDAGWTEWSRFVPPRS